MPRVLSPSEVQGFRDDACAVATRLFAEGGEESVTLRALARELGVSPMTPYRYFENKADIFEAMVVAGFGRLSARSERIASLHADPLTRLRALGRAYIEFGVAEPHTYRLMFQLDRPGEADADVAKQATLLSCWETVKATIQEAIDRDQLTGDANTLAHVTWVALHGMVTLHLSSRLSLGRSLDELLDPMMDSFIQGNLARPAEATP